MRKLLFLFLSATLLTACTNRKNCNNKSISDFVAGACVDTAFSRFISKDTANKMISSYLNSLPSTTGDSDLRSLVIDLDQLAKYTSANHKKARYLKLCFAHTLEYINAGHGNTPAGYRTGAFTLVLAAADAQGNYLFYNGSNVMDYEMPCPPTCPPGNAANPLITQ